MIRKPSADWQQRSEGAAVRTVRAAAAVGTGGANMARRGGAAAMGLVFGAIAIFWGYTAIGSSLPTMIGLGAMAASMAWVGRKLLAKALAAPE